MEAPAEKVQFVNELDAIEGLPCLAEDRAK
jgi:hypothetical protein